MSIETGAIHKKSRAIRQAVHSLMERLEERRLLSGDVRLVGITGNKQGELPPELVGTDETLWEIHYGSAGTTDPAFLDGFADVTPNPPDTILSISTTTGVTQGKGALRVEADQGGYWGIRSPNLVDLLQAGVNTLSYDLTLNNIELNGGSFGGGTDNSFNGYAQNNALAVQISSGAFVQQDFASAHGTDSLNTNATWSGVNGTRHITWDLTTFTAPNGMSLSDYIATNHPAEAHFWLTTQGQDTNGHVGPMRFYFDNVQVSGVFGTRTIGDFELVNISKIATMPFVPDTAAIGFNPETGLLHRTSGSESYRDNPAQVGYRDDHFMETLNIDDPLNSQVGVFNADYEGEPGFGPYGLPAPFPTFLLPDHRRTDDETDPTFGDMRGPNEYHALRDLTWSTTDHLFYGTAENGIFTLTADGQSTFIGNPGGIAGDPKGITFHTFEGQRRLVISERDGPRLWMIDPSNGQTVTNVVMVNEAGIPLPGVLSVVEDPTSNTLLGIAKSVNDPGNAFARELIRIDPITGQTTSLGPLGIHMADLAFIVSPPSVKSSEFLYEDAPQRLVFSFTQNVGDSITKADLTVEKLGPGGGPIDFGDPIYDIYSNTVTFPFNTLLADGNYRAILSSAGVTNTLDMPITANEEVPFFWLNGDLNRDRTVSISDFIDLASKFNSPATKWSDGDLNYDGQVTVSDFIDLAANFNKTLAPPSPALAPASEALTVADSDSAQTLDVQADSAVVAKNESAGLFSRSSRRHSHHQRHAPKASRHWIGRAGAY